MHQSIAIETPPTTDAACILANNYGRWTVKSPGLVNVERSKEDIRVECVKAGWNDSVSTIPSSFEPTAAGNVLLGGIIGFGVDAATGAINEYPRSFQVPMTQVMIPPVPNVQK